jgi:hypothetical protein
LKATSLVISTAILLSSHLFGLKFLEQETCITTTMPRRGDKFKNDKDSKGPPPSHPSENYPEHRSFLIRSLERNDVDMAALMKLNKSLHKAKERILQTCGELVLLDLGCGRLTLINDELHEVTANSETGQVADENTQHHLTPAQKEACVDFLLRMKLRRKLSNRLIRRLTRVATAMDGSNVAPPAPPKYGDLRLHVDQEVVEARVQEWKQREAAKKRIEAALNGDETAYAPTTVESADSHKETDDVEMKEKLEEASSPAESKEAAARKAEPPQADDGTTPMDIDSSGGDAKYAPESNEKDAETPKTAARKSKDDASNTGPKTSIPPTLESDYALLREYDDVYQKIWDPETKRFKFHLPAEDQEAEPEYTEIKNGAGIGAVNKGMTLPDREADYKRWQASLLVKIPDQPTLEELELKNRVFCLEERRKRCLEDAEENDDEEENRGKKSKSDTDDSQTNSKEATELKENEKSSMVDKNEATKAKDDREESKKKFAPMEDPLKPKRPISFAATPSFHEQDLARIKLIHRDMVGHLKSEQGRQNLASATNDYNKALSQSLQCLQNQHSLQHSLTFVIAKGREELSKANNEYSIQVAKEKQLWMTEKRAHDATRLQSLLPSKSGNSAEGTPLIMAYVRTNANNGMQAAVGKCLADVIDGSLLVSEGRAPIPKFKDFVLPPRPVVNEDTGEDMAQRQRRVETDYRNRYNLVTAQLQKSEEERTSAWRRMMKAKADLELYHQAVVSGTRSSILVHQNNHQNFPLPPLRGSVTATMPRELTRQPAHMASYRPPSNAPGSLSANKYSADKVRQRKAADGTVAPVSEPKKTEEGLYLRPAGRTRKGMRWDAFAGVWVPQNQ